MCLADLVAFYQVCEIPRAGQEIDSIKTTHEGRLRAMTRPPYRALRILLSVLALLTAVGGLLVIFSGKPLVIRMFLSPPEAEISTLLLVTMKEGGGLILMLSLMLFFASRDPVRNVAIINALIVGLCVMVVTPLVSLYTLDIGRLYPGYEIWGRSIIRLVLAALLFYLRPREVQAGVGVRAA